MQGLDNGFFSETKVLGLYDIFDAPAECMLELHGRKIDLLTDYAFIAFIAHCNVHVDFSNAHDACLSSELD